MEKLYMVIFEGYWGSYGSYTYLQGIYSSKEIAEKHVKAMLEKYPYLDVEAEDIQIVEVAKDTPLEVRRSESEWRYGIQSDVCLGGYAE